MNEEERMTELTEFTDYSVLQWPVFRHLCPELSPEEFNGMSAVVCGYLFGDVEEPSA